MTKPGAHFQAKQIQFLGHLDKATYYYFAKQNTIGEPLGLAEFWTFRKYTTKESGIAVSNRQVSLVHQIWQNCSAQFVG